MKFNTFANGHVLITRSGVTARTSKTAAQRAVPAKAAATRAAKKA